MPSTRQDWEDNMIDTGLFQWEVHDDGRILVLQGTADKILLAADNVWMIEGDIKNVEYKIVYNFEELLDRITNKEIRAKLLFHLDLFV
jgi:hypothetical protein